MKFISRYGSCGKISDWSQEYIKNEQMLFSASVSFARAKGGLITQEFIQTLPDGWQNCIIDSRVHMLMPGWFPCIPGWHHDDVPRSREDGQPNYKNPEYHSEHIACVVGDSSLTAFINADVILDEVPLGKVVYREWHEQIEHQIMENNLTYSFIKPSELVRFDWQTFHRGSQATKSGWRLFIRASRNTNRKFENEVRKQVQVYISPVNRGW